MLERVICTVAREFYRHGHGACGLNASLPGAFEIRRQLGGWRARVCRGVVRGVHEVVSVQQVPIHIEGLRRIVVPSNGEPHGLRAVDVLKLRVAQFRDADARGVSAFVLRPGARYVGLREVRVVVLREQVQVVTEVVHRRERASGLEVVDEHDLIFAHFTGFLELKKLAGCSVRRGVRGGQEERVGLKRHFSIYHLRE